MRALLAAASFLLAVPALADVKVEDPDEYYQLARDYMAEEKWNLAVEQLEKSLAIKNDDYRVWIDLGDALVPGGTMAIATSPPTTRRGPRWSSSATGSWSTAAPKS